MKLSREEVQHIALLARLALSEQEREKLREQLSHILESVAALKEADTSDVPPTTQSITLQNVFRNDEICLSLDRDQVLANAPQQEEGSFRVRPVLE